MGMIRTVRNSRGLFRVAFFALLVTAMVAGALHLGALPAQADQATVTWSAPSTYTNGTTATTLAGYNLYMGTASGSYSQKLNVGNVNSYTAVNLNSGSTYYFAITAYDTTGVESAKSTEVSKTIPAAPVTYSITATAGAGGTISALNNTKVSVATNSTSTITTVTVTSGASQSFSITPSTGYKVQGVTVDGTSVGAVTSYTFSNVAANHSISASFAAATTSYSITASAGTGGSISPSGTASVTSGGSQSYTITPATGYSISGVSVDGASVGAVSSYTFSNVAANHTIQANFSATSSTGASTTTFATNSAGPQYVSSGSGVTYLADTKFSGGGSGSTTSSISGTPDPTLYQTERWGNFSYSVPATNGNYNVTLKFAEIYWAAAGKRVFNVLVNGQTAISNLDIYAKVGKNAAYDVTVPVNVTNGAINITFQSVVDYAKVSAISIAPAPAPATTTSGTVVFATNSAGPQYQSSSTATTYTADAKYSGGSTGSTTSAISGTTDSTLYQTERWGNFSYSIPVTNGNYNLTLKFAEIYWAAAGKRVFNVLVNGQTAISNLDIYAKVGKNAAYDVVIPVSVTNGAINVTFQSVVDYAKVNAILVKSN